MSLHFVPQIYRDKIAQGLCPLCSRPVDIDDFRDDLSRTEYQISGLCQDCQDKVFKGGVMNPKKFHEMIKIKTEKAAEYWNKNLPGVQVFHGWLKPESMQKIEDEISAKMQAGWCSEKWLEDKLDEWSFAVKEWIDAINKHRGDISI